MPASLEQRETETSSWLVTRLARSEFGRMFRANWVYFMASLPTASVDEAVAFDDHDLQMARNIC